LVVVEVAPPQLPVGAVFTASCRSPVIGVGAMEGVITTAPAQLAWAIIFVDTLTKINKKTVVRMDCNMVLKGFGVQKYILTPTVL
jgi:hypothetical protein